MVVLEDSRMKRRWFQFRLRTLLGVVTLAAVATGLVVRHVQFVQQRIHYHEARLANCEERIMMREDPQWLSSQWRSARTNVDENLPVGHLLFNPPTSARKDLWTIVQKVDRDIALLGKSKGYHQQQIRQYRAALWRPWIRVQETREEILDLPPKISPDVPQSVSDPPSALLIATPPPSSADTGVQQGKPRYKARRGQPIERPLPHDFDNRDLRVDKTTDA
jgi:hypothetical protein